jgi:hypothetical protein
MMGLFGSGIKESKPVTLPISTFATELRKLVDSKNLSEQATENLWDLWCWVAYFQMTERNISGQEFAELFRLNERTPTDPIFKYQKNDVRLAKQAESLYSEVQSIFRPFLSTAFLPPEYVSDIWPLTGKPLKRVKSQIGFGQEFPAQIVQAFERFDFSESLEFEFEEIDALAWLISKSFTDILKLSNADVFKRKDRLGMRLAAFEVLPLYLIFFCARHRPS